MILCTFGLCNILIYRNDIQPVYEIPPPSYSAEQILRILLNPNIDGSKICHTRPTNVSKSSTFVVNITNLGHPDDIKKDSFGKWNHSGSHTVPFRASILDDGYVDLEKCAPGASGSNVYYLRRLYSVHP